MILVFHLHLAMYWVQRLNANEISLAQGYLAIEIAGIKLRKNVDFAVNPVNQHRFALGRVVQYGREQ